jgi:hypothetical protein
LLKVEALVARHQQVHFQRFGIQRLFPPAHAVAPFALGQDQFGVALLHWRIDLRRRRQRAGQRRLEDGWRGDRNKPPASSSLLSN